MGEPTARLRVAESLRFFLPARHRRGDVTFAVNDSSTLGHVVESLGIPRTEIGELRVDGRAASVHDRARADDLVEVLPVRRPQPIRDPRFLLDVHLGALARRMRLLGLDTTYGNDATDDDLVAQAAAGTYVLLTKDRGLLRRRALPAGAYVRGSEPNEQLQDVLDRFAPPLAPWTRCLACNGLLQPVDKRLVQHLVEPGTRRTYTVFSRCPGCGQVYWRGAHYRRLEAIVDRATGANGVFQPDE
jgi:uncharacterized protein with PIN domain